MSSGEAPSGPIVAFSWKIFTSQHFGVLREGGGQWLRLWWDDSWKNADTDNFRMIRVTVTISSILGASLIKYWPNDSEIIESYSGLGRFLTQ